MADVIRFYFECPSCGAIYGLLAETFHGQGGTWSKLWEGEHRAACRLG